VDHGAAKPFEGLAGKLIYDAHYWAVFWSFTLGLSYRSSGRHQFPKSGPALVVANHQSFIDPIFVSLAVGRPLTFLARSNLFKGGNFDRLIRTYGAMPIDRGFGKEGIKSVVATLETGRPVLIFPEGERTHNGSILPLKPGISLLLDRANVPVIPVGIAGAFELWPRTRKVPYLSPLFLPSEGRSISVHIGKPMMPEDRKGKSREEVLAVLEAEIRGAYDSAEAIRRK
jgi:1-acyl-sn-glycerol-3-phosphate acyltransferase